MKGRPLLCFFLLAGLSGGCSWCPYAAHNLLEAPFQVVDHRCQLWQFRSQARMAWRHFRDADPNVAYSDDYAAGFMDGYVDYLDADGTGDPPAAPPNRYEHSRYHRTPEGVQAIEDWFDGFRQGTAVAQASGQRELVVVPLALPPRQAASAGGRSGSPDHQLVVPPPPELLPEPRKPPAGNDPAR